MNWYYATLALLAISVFSFYMSRARAVSSVRGKTSELHSLPSYHGLYSFLITIFVGFGLLIAANIVSNYIVEYSLTKSLPTEVSKLDKVSFESYIERVKKLAAEEKKAGKGESKDTFDKPDPAQVALAEKYRSWQYWQRLGIGVLAIVLALFASFRSLLKIGPKFRARNQSEQIIYGILAVCAGVAILTTIGIFGSLISTTVKFFQDIPIQNFLFGTTWSPLSGISDGKLAANKVGAIPLFVGTFVIAIIAMLVAVPIGLMAAIYLSDYASPAVRAWVKPMLEILAGIPTVVYGFFAALTVAPALRDFGEWVGLDISAQSALAAGVVMGIMIIPFISSLSDDVISAVPNSLRDGSYGVGATKAETITRVVLPAALPGIVSAVLLGFSRAVGETMIVVMAAGSNNDLVWNPLQTMTTVTVQIVQLIKGDIEADLADGPAFALGLTLFLITLGFNVFALRIVQRYHQKYD